MKQKDNRNELIVVYLMKWYGIYLISLLLYLGFVTKLYYRAIKCLKININVKDYIKLGPKVDATN
jgi:hypothetical protein